MTTASPQSTGTSSFIPDVRVPVAWTLGGLGAGLALGIVLEGRTAAGWVLPLADLVGTLWLRALQMTIVPLVAALLVIGIVQTVLAARAGRVALFSLGMFAAVLATLIGTTVGAFAGYFGGKIGDFFEWVYNVFTSIPDILLIFAFAAVLGRGIDTVILILGLTGWTGMYRQVRAEYMKHRGREYVRAAEAIGAGHLTRMFVHILPNVSHVILVRMSLLVVAFIKVEVILSFLGLGVPVDQVSWGTMLSEAQAELVLGYWWQLAAATLFMAIFVTAFSLLTDALRDALDPKLR